jgi:hypothetical protein
LTASSVSGIPVEWFDYRYFYGRKGVGYYTCGLAREAAAVVIRKRSPGMLSDPMWLRSLPTFKNNPFIVGFLVEQACLSFISCTGFHHGSANWGPLKATIFEGDLISAIPPGDCEIFFIPQAPNFKDIDALYLRVHHLDEIVLVIPIQITIAKAHKDSEAAFYSRWSDWEKRFAGYEVITTFVWIVENKRSWEAVDEVFRETRKTLKQISPAHQRLFITVADTFPDLGLQLAMIRQM